MRIPEAQAADRRALLVHRRDQRVEVVGEQERFERDQRVVHQGADAREDRVEVGRGGHGGSVV